MIKLLFAAAVATAFLTASARSADFATAATHAILIDAPTGAVLFEKGADDRTPPASLAKLMTIEILFAEITAGRLKMEDSFTVSENAWRKGSGPSEGSKMFLKIGERVPIGDLLRGIIVQSGNDASIVAAEGLSGTEIAFAERMTARGRELGLRDSVFRTSTGLPDPEQHTTMRDLAILSRHIIETYPDLYRIFAEREFTWNNITQKNRNPILDDGIGADGLKTGFTRDSGYGLVGSAVVADQRLIVAFNGTKSDGERATEARKLLEWGFRQFRQVTAYEAGEVVAEASVYGGEKGSVPLVSKGPLRILTPRDNPEPLRARAVYSGPVPAPVEAGARIGSLRIMRGDQVVQDVPLYAGESVGRGRLHRRALSAVRELLLGWW